MYFVLFFFRSGRGKNAIKTQDVHYILIFHCFKYLVQFFRRAHFRPAVSSIEINDASTSTTDNVYRDQTSLSCMMLSIKYRVSVWQFAIHTPRQIFTLDSSNRTKFECLYSLKDILIADVKYPVV